ncbi:MAG TPA: 16S rRNA (cytidine(1402)-2'-O)-methyltransferase, partial [Thermodesulfobacteriota bacterium]|nr:16S rRNA (cytidine(1402)-2'-O)-methyltransferase [Thermodesulfobacteriota bacterium]
MPVAPGPLYIVATPIGNLEDITYRAVSILKRVDYIAAEDTRRTKKLLTAYGLSGRLVPYHDHNKQRQAGRIVADLIDGQSVALVSDAGTPGISDPGYLLINEAIRNNIAVIPIPGPSAIIAALSVSGLPTDRFAFEGYLPRKPSRRRACIEEFKQEMRTL